MSCGGKSRVIGTQRREDPSYTCEQGEKFPTKLLISELMFELALRVELQFTRSRGKISGQGKQPNKASGKEVLGMVSGWREWNGKGGALEMPRIKL